MQDCIQLCDSKCETVNLRYAGIFFASPKQFDFSNIIARLRLECVACINASMRDVQMSLMKTNIQTAQDLKTYQGLQDFLSLVKN